MSKKHVISSLSLSILLMLTLLFVNIGPVPSAVRADVVAPVEPLIQMQSSQATTETIEVQIASDVAATVSDLSKARVVVALAPRPAMSIASAQADVIASLASSSPAFELVYRYETVPGLVGEVDSAGLEALSRNPNVRAVALDAPVQTALSESAVLIGADVVHDELGYTGDGVTIAVLDTGIDAPHADLSGDLVAQKCFNRNTCPPNNSDESDNARDDNGHGTHVAGIITSDGTESPRGIAPDAGLVSVRVLNGSGSGWSSDIVAGLDWVIANQATYNIRLVNLSLTTGLYEGSCDRANANTINFATAIENAAAVGIVTFAASGNDAAENEIGAPACVEEAVAVGSVYDSDVGATSWSFCNDNQSGGDRVACFSNSSPVLDLLAPGSIIESAAVGGGSVAQSGTSMAAPQAAAVAALMLEANPGLNANQITSILRQSGVPVVDERSNRVTPRIDAVAAVNAALELNVAQPTATPNTNATATPTPAITATAMPSPTPTPTSSEVNTITLSLVPGEAQVGLAQTTTMRVQVNPASGLSELGFLLLFNPNLVEVVDADPTEVGVQIAPSRLVNFANTNLVSNGEIEFLATLTDTTSGAGTIAEITWRGMTAGEMTLALTGTQTAPGIRLLAENGQLTVAPVISQTSGTILLQGRTAHEGITVTVSTAACPQISAASFVPITDNFTTLNPNTNGSFETGPLNGEPLRCLQATAPGFLYGQNTAPQGNLGTLYLRAGDINADGVIDILDLAQIAGEFRSENRSLSDLNADGVVDILDLALVAGNFRAQGPSTDWRE